MLSFLHVQTDAYFMWRVNQIFGEQGHVLLAKSGRQEGLRAEGSGVFSAKSRKRVPLG